MPLKPVGKASCFLSALVWELILLSNISFAEVSEAGHMYGCTQCWLGVGLSLPCSEVAVDLLFQKPGAAGMAGRQLVLPQLHDGCLSFPVSIHTLQVSLIPLLLVSDQ